MKFFLRIEVWVLLLLTAGATAYVFLTGGSEARQAIIENARPADSDTHPVLKGVTVERDFGNARVDITVRVTNAHHNKLQLLPPAVRLVDGRGQEVPPFILPTEPAAELAPQTTADVLLRYWLERENFAGSLTLEIEGQKLEVKNSASFDLDKLTNAKPQRFSSAEWKL